MKKEFELYISEYDLEETLPQMSTQGQLRDYLFSNIRKPRSSNVLRKPLTQSFKPVKITIEWSDSSE